MREFLTVDELSEYLGIKRSNLYSKVERKEIPHYRVGRLILFKKDEIDAFMAGRRVEVMDVKKKAKRVLHGIKRPRANVERTVKKAIEGAKNSPYNWCNGNRNGSREEVIR